MKVNRSQVAAQRRIAAALAEVGFALPGSLTVKAYKCGKTNCRCKGNPPALHGPYAFWTRKIDNKTVTRMLNPDELTEYQPLFDNARKPRELIAQLQALTLELVDVPEDQRRGPAPSRTTRRPPKADRAQPGVGRAK
jgi:hypothetical protein